jgi:hypothetical protein
MLDQLDATVPLDHDTNLGRTGNALNILGHEIRCRCDQ